MRCCSELWLDACSSFHKHASSASARRGASGSTRKESLLLVEGIKGSSPSLLNPNKV